MHEHRRVIALVAVAVALVAFGVGVGAVIWAGKDKPAAVTTEALSLQPPDTVTMALSAGVWHCIADGRRRGLVVTSTTGGRHAAGSYHYSARAADQAGAYSRMVALQRHLFRTRWKYLEVIGPVPAWGVKNGHPFRYSAALLAQHTNHVHCAAG